jgi:iron(III) transport system ATP-binding protein
MTDAAPQGRHVLELQDVMKVFTTPGGAVAAVDSVNIRLEGSEFFTMLGPSGCGKTTTLRMIAGLEQPSGGRILFDGRDLTQTSPFARNIGMVFQSYALFPHLTLFENVAYGLRVRKLPEAEIRARVERMIALLGLGRMVDRHPADLSGGQQQRVSIARALVYEPAMLLLDEPLANLDAKLRVEMREEIRRLQKQLGILLIYVTHDQEEAMSVSDRIAVFEHGRLRQLGHPQDIYARPASLFVADFVGKANFLPARVTTRDGTGVRVLVTADHTAGGHAKNVARIYALRDDEAAKVPARADGLLMIRPEHMRLAKAGSIGFPCTVGRVQFLGSFTRYLADCPDLGGSVTIESTRSIEGLAEGDAAACDFDGSDAILYSKAT